MREEGARIYGTPGVPNNFPARKDNQQRWLGCCILGQRVETICLTTSDIP